MVFTHTPKKSEEVDICQLPLAGAELEKCSSRKAESENESRQPDGTECVSSASCCSSDGCDRAESGSASSVDSSCRTTFPGFPQNLSAEYLTAFVNITQEFSALQKKCNDLLRRNDIDVLGTGVR